MLSGLLTFAPQWATAMRQHGVRITSEDMPSKRTKRARLRALRAALRLTLAGLAAQAFAWPAWAQAQSERIENGVAVFAALDKVTARISHLEIELGQTVQFGALKVTPRACYTRPPTDPPRTTAFVEVDEIKLNGEEQRIFTGWMFAQSPGLHAVEHPVFDVWLTNCKAEAGEQSAGSEENSARSDRASSNRR